MIADYFRYGIVNLRRRKVRSWLTMIGIFVGIAAVVALISLGQGLQKYIDEEFEKMGRDTMMIYGKGGFIPGISDVALTVDDMKEVEKVIGITGAAGIPFGAVELEFNDIKRYSFGMGMPLSGDEKRYMDELFLGYGVEVGRKLKKGDKYKVNLGHYFLDMELFDGNVKLGDKIKVNGKEFDAVGFYEVIGNPQDDQNVYIPRDAFYEISDVDEGEIAFIYAKMDPNENPELVAERVEKKLRKSRDLDEGKEDFVVQTPEEMLEAFQNVFLIVQTLLIGIAAISLLVGGIGIMNTMYTAVLERTREIGIMKAIGARNSHILSLFLIESGILGLVGGAIGILIGMSISKLVEIIATLVLQSSLLRAYFPWYLILGALAFSFIVGSLSGLMPARRAARMNPVDALRYE